MLIFLLMLTTVVVSLVLFLRRDNLRVPAAEAVSGGRRRAQRLIGQYQLGDVVAHMTQLAVGSAIPSVRTTYLPASLTFGVGEKDAAAWGELFQEIADELCELILAAARERDLALVAPLEVRLVVDPAATPGKPVLVAAKMRPEAPARAEPTMLLPDEATDLCAWPLSISVRRDGEAIDEQVLGAGEWTVGRARDCTIVVDDPAASRTHARVIVSGSEFWVEDAGSAAGTLLNGQPIGERMPCIVGDVVQLTRRTSLVLV
jgi:hypothetical protein